MFTNMQGARLRKSPGARRQSGSILIFAAFGISLVVSLLAIVDMGFLYYYKREYQKAADLAALAGAQGLARSLAEGAGNSTLCDTANTEAQTNAGHNLGSRGRLDAVSCGVWTPAAAEAPTGCVASEDLRLTSPAGVNYNAVRAYVHGKPPQFLLPGTTITACAIATANTPLAALKIRNTLLTLSASNSALLNPLVGTLLGGSINVDVLGWQGLANADVSLLDYFEELGPLIGVDLSAGDYSDLLNADVSLLQLIDAGIGAVGQDSTVGVTLGLLRSQILNLPIVQNESINLEPLLGLDLAHMNESALDLNLNLLDLILASVQVANNENAVAVGLPISIPGVAGINAFVSVIEKPQLSAIGIPDVDDISVKTAQIRVYVAVKLGILKAVNDLLDGVLALLSPLTNLLDLFLSTTYNPIACGTECLGEYKLLYLHLLPSGSLDVGLDVGKSTAEVTAYDCEENQTYDKSLDVEAKSSVAGLTVGKFKDSDVTHNGKNGKPLGDFFKVTPQVAPVTILELGDLTQKSSLLVSCSGGDPANWFMCYKTENGGWTKNKADAKLVVQLGVRLGIGTPACGTNPSCAATAATPAPLLGGRAHQQVFAAPEDTELPDIRGPRNPEDRQLYKPIDKGSLVGSLSDTLHSIRIETYYTPGSWWLTQGLSNLLNGILDLLINGSGSFPGLLPLVTDALGLILDPVLNFLTSLLGVDLLSAQDAANLTCNTGATLVD